MEDFLVWLPNRKGIYFVKSAYGLEASFNDLAASFPYWNQVWCSVLHGRHKFLIWRVIVGALLIKKRLASRFGLLVSDCPLCEHVEEDEYCCG